MTERVFPIRPGIYSEATDRTAQNRWARGNLVRFQNGLPEKAGGWLKSNLDTPGGVPRNALDWARLDGTNVTVVGTSTGLYAMLGADTVWTEITPTRQASTGYTNGTESPLVNPFATTDTSNIVAVTDAAHGAIVNSSVEFTGASAIGGIPAGDLNKLHKVATIVDASTYTIVVTTSATSTVDPGGGAAVEFRYRINPGLASAEQGLGWGIGPWGEEAWGTARSEGASEDKTIFPALTWSLALWGEDLEISRIGYGIYTWDASASPIEPAEPLTNAPTQTEAILVGEVGQHLIAFGSVPSTGGDYDPLNIRWCSSRAYTSWTPALTNSAGEDRISGGNKIVTALNVGAADILVFTDSRLYRMTYVGAPRIYGLRPVGITGLVGPNACIEYAGIGYWMAKENFYAFDNVLRVLPCDLQTYVFEDLNRDQLSKIIAGTINRFNEILWFYPSADSNEINRCVVYDTVQRTWWSAELARTAWFDTSLRYDKPYGYTPAGASYHHESGSSADGMPMGEYLESFDLSLLDGTQEETTDVLRVGCVVPDFSIQEQPLEMTLYGRKRPQSPRYATGPHTLAPTDERKCYVLRARQIALRVSGASYTGHWRMGMPSFDIKQDGLV